MTEIDYGISKLTQFLDRNGYHCELERDWPHDATWYIDIIRTRSSPGQQRRPYLVTGNNKDLKKAIEKAIENATNDKWFDPAHE